MGFSRARARAVSSTVSAADRTIWVARDRRTPAWFRAPTWQDASLMEYTCCSRYDKITGSENIRMVFQHVPFVRSMGPNRDFFVFSISKTSDSKDE